MVTRGQPARAAHPANHKLMISHEGMLQEQAEEVPPEGWKGKLAIGWF